MLDTGVFDRNCLQTHQIQTLKGTDPKGDFLYCKTETVMNCEATQMSFAAVHTISYT